MRVLKDNAVPSSAFVASPIKLAISAPESQPSGPAGTSAAPPPEIMDAQESEVFNGLFLLRSSGFFLLILFFLFNSSYLQYIQMHP